MIQLKPANRKKELHQPEKMTKSNRQFKLELFQTGTISDVYKFMEEGLFTEWDRVADNLSLSNDEARGLAWGIKGHNYPWILANVDFVKGGKVLDVGGAYSLLPVIINERCGTEVWVVDDFGVESEELIWSRWGDRERQKARYPNVNYVFERLGNVSATSLEKEYFDVIYSVSALEHIPSSQMKSVFDHMLYILKPDGLLVHCVDVSLCSSVEEAVDAISSRSLRYVSGWLEFLKEYFGEANILIDDKIREFDEIESSLNPDVVTDSPEIVFKYYHPNQQAKPFKKTGTFTFMIRSLSSGIKDEIAHRDELGGYGNHGIRGIVED
jgi:ubiquinone/menaquinone biosynthesis C-methylase UbiE